MRRLGALATRQFRRALGRSLLTAAGVTLGVGVLFGVLVANASASRAFTKQFVGLSHPQVGVQAPGGELEEDVVERLAALPDVFSAVAWAGFPGRIVSGDDPPDESVWISGARQASGEAFEPEERDDGDFDGAGRRPGPEGFEIGMSRDMARRLGAKLGSEVMLETPSGRQAATVVEMWWRKDGGRIDDVNIGTSVETARRIGGALARTSFANVRLRDGTDVDVWLARHRGDLGTGVVMSRNGPNPVEMRRFIQLMEAGFAAGAGVAVFIGGFLIFLTLSLQVAERAALFGTLRALGAHRWQVARVVLAEGFVLGVVATTAGLGLGLFAAVGLNRVVAGLYEIERPSLYVAPRAVVLAIVTGVGVTVVAALLPAWRAARHDPITSMRRRSLARERIGRLWMAGVVALIAGVAWSFTRAPSPNDPSLLLILLGSVFVLPALVGPLGTAVGRVTRRVAPGVGDVGVLHLVKERTRSGYTMALVMVVLAMVLTLGTTEHTFRQALDRILDRVLAADLAVNIAGGLDDAGLRKLSSVDGIAVATPFRGVPTVVRTGGRAAEPLTAFATVIDPSTYFDALGFPWVDGDDGEAKEALAEGRAVIITDTQAKKLAVGRGDTVRLETPQGLRPYEVVGVTATLEPQQRVVIGLPSGIEDFGVGPAFFVRVKATEGVAVGSVEESIKAAFPDRSDLNFIRQGEERAQSASFMNRYFAVFLVVILVALAVGMLGLANTLALSVFRRTRELGVLRAVGTHRRQLAAMVAVEALTLTSAAAVLAVPLGALLAYVILRATVNIDLIVTYAFDWLMVPIVVLVALLLACAAAVAPARRAARVDPVVALRFE